jgi:hypothetical protein
MGYEIQDPETKSYFGSGSRGQESFGSRIRNNIHFLMVYLIAYCPLLADSTTLLLLSTFFTRLTC